MRAALLLLVLVPLLAACRNPRSARPDLPTAGAAGTEVHADFYRHDIVEIAVKLPGGDARPPFLLGVREGLYREALDRSYSPLRLEYVDRMETDLTSVAGPSHLTSAVTTMRPHGEGFLVSGWAALTAPTPEGGEVVYTMELTDYFVATEKDLRDRLLAGDAEAERRAQRAAGERFGRALLTQLPGK